MPILMLTAKTALLNTGMNHICRDAKFRVSTRILNAQQTNFILEISNAAKTEHKPLSSVCTDFLKG